MTGQVSRMRGRTRDGEMGLVGYAIAAGVAVVLLPVLPLLAVVWVLTRFSSDERDGPVRG